MKKLVCLVAVLVMLFSVVHAAEDKVEITFCVGESTLTINGEAVTVEKPYVVGAGVTLVPVRVITEAFGAEVGWEAQTKTITLSYPDVEIVLQIDNPMAEVNKQATTLLSAPELTANGFTMVPLRFISETFGATVSYDDATGKITVVKEKAASGETVTGGVESKFVGDSYYGWRMENPEGMLMDDRFFDGTMTSFISEEDDNYGIVIFVRATPEDFDFGKDYIEAKNSVGTGKSIVKIDKIEADGVQEINLQLKDKSTYVIQRKLVKGSRTFQIVAIFSNEDTKQRDAWIQTVDSFTAEYKEEDTHDLSNVENGMRTFSAEDVNFSIDVPEDYVMASEEDAVNFFAFFSVAQEDDFSRIYAQIYSKSDVGGAEDMATRDYEGNVKKSNPDVVRVKTALCEQTFDGISGYYYETYENFKNKDAILHDFFFEIGEYVYNVTVEMKNPNAYGEDFAKKVFESIRAEEIDANEVGMLLRNISDETPYTVKVDDYAVTLPGSYAQEDKEELEFYGQNNGVYVSFEFDEDKEATISQAKKVLTELQKGVKDGGAKIISKTEEVTLNGIKFVTMTFSEEVDEDLYYYQYFIGIKSKNVCTVIVAYPEEYYSDYSREQVKEMVGSISIEK